MCQSYTPPYIMRLAMNRCQSCWARTTNPFLTLESRHVVESIDEHGRSNPIAIQYVARIEEIPLAVVILKGRSIDCKGTAEGSVTRRPMSRYGPSGLALCATRM